MLIFTAGLGVVGSALASTLATALGTGYIAARVKSVFGEQFRALHWSDFRRLRVMLRRWQQIAWPDAVFGIFSYGADVLLVALVAALGIDTLATYRLVGTAQSVVWTLIFGVASAIAILAGQRIGADDPAGQRLFIRAGTAVMLVAAATASILLVAFSNSYFAMYTDDSSVREQAVSMVVALPILAPIMLAGSVFGAQLRAHGDTKGVVYVSVVSTICGTVPTAWILLHVLEYGVWSIYLAVMIGWSLRTVASYARLHHTNRVRTPSL